jgi:hypothetical protein
MTLEGLFNCFKTVKIIYMKNSDQDFCLGYLKDRLNVLKFKIIYKKNVSRISVFVTWMMV